MFYSTFNLPDFTEGIPLSKTNAHAIGTTTGGTIPNITGEAQVERGGYNDYVSGAFTLTGTTSVISDRSSAYSSQPSLGFDASRSSSVYQNVTSVTPAGQYVYGYIIKY